MFAWRFHGPDKIKAKHNLQIRSSKGIELIVEGTTSSGAVEKKGAVSFVVDFYWLVLKRWGEESGHQPETGPENHKGSKLKIVKKKVKIN